MCFKETLSFFLDSFLMSEFIEILKELFLCSKGLRFFFHSNSNAGSVGRGAIRVIVMSETEKGKEKKNVVVFR